MEERSNKTIICSVLFLDIVEYSKKSVAGQISLKDRFNSYLSDAIRDVPVSDRIILDTGDGAAVNFLGDVESALTAALRLRDSLLGEDPDADPKLLVRIGINLGPVRLVRDINGQPNIVGDGINVAQRVMAFAEAGQILVSRSYYDAVSRLSPEYTGMFHYQGSRTDKHVREHEVYAIGYAAEQAEAPAEAPAPVAAEADQDVSAVPAAAPKRGMQYALIGGLILLGAGLLITRTHKTEEVAAPAVETMSSAATPASSPIAVPASAVAAPVAKSAPAEPASAVKSGGDKAAHQAKPKPEVAKKTATPTKPADSHPQTREPAKPAAKTESEAQSGGESSIVIGCKEDTQVFLDGTAKGRLASGTMTLAAKPGKHKVILTHPSFGIFTEEVSIEAGKVGRVRPKVCN